MMVNDEIIQKLMDGELDSMSQYELIQQIDNQSPSKWRDVALAALEEKMIREALVLDIAHSDRSEVVRETGRSRLFQPLAIAASFILGIACVFFISPQTDIKEEIVVENKIKQQQLNDSVVVVSSTDSGQDFNIPVYNSWNHTDEAIRAFNAPFALTREIVTAFHKRGYNLSPQTAYISAELEKGQEVIIPVSYVAIPELNNTKK